MISKFVDMFQIWIPIKSGLIFWIVGLAIYFANAGLITSENINNLNNNKNIIMLIALGLLLITAIGYSLINYLSLPILRLLEGYYWFNCLKQLYVLENKRCQKIDERFQFLRGRDYKNLSKKELAEYTQIQHKKMSIPLNESDRMPTRLGNLLRAFELRPYHKYGLDSVVCWSRLWPLLPEEMKKELITARENMDATVHIWVWSVLFTISISILIGSAYSFLTLGIGVILIWFVVYHILLLNAAETYGQLVEASFDLYRFLLYKALYWPLPKKPCDEREMGERLSVYLSQGLLKYPNIRFTFDDCPEENETEAINPQK